MNETMALYDHCWLQNNLHCFDVMNDLSLVGNQRNNTSEINIPALLFPCH